MVKKEKELNPIIEKKEINIDRDLLLDIAENIENNTINFQKQDDSESFFKAIVSEMNSDKNISTKTEYLGVTENFSGTRLEFFSIYANIPFLKKFVNIFETKRVSLNRQGRSEMVALLKERNQELKTNEMKNFSRLFGVEP